MTTNTNAATWTDKQYLEQLAAHYQHSPVPEIRWHHERLMKIAAALTTAAAVPPEGWVMVPVELANRVQESLGEFLMDHGWSQRDMDTSDEFGAVLLAADPKAEPVPAGEYPPLPRPFIFAHESGGVEWPDTFDATQMRAYVDADRAMRVQAASENIRSILVRCRDFIDTTKVPAYPAGADLADEIDVLLAAQVSPEPAGECGNCFDGKSNMDHDCRKCGGTGVAQAAPAAVAEHGPVAHDEDLLEQLYWEFDAQRRRTGEERLAFKVKMRSYASEFRRRSIGKMTFAQSVSDDMMNLVDRLGSECDDIDPRAWKHLLVYAPQAVPQPAPVAQGDAEDAARYRFLAGHCRSTSEHWGGRWSIIVDGPAPKSHDSEDDFDEAVDAARKQGGA